MVRQDFAGQKLFEINYWVGRALQSGFCLDTSSLVRILKLGVGYRSELFITIVVQRSLTMDWLLNFLHNIFYAG